MLALNSGVAEENNTYQTGGFEPIEPASSFGDKALLIGAGGNLALANSDIVDSGVGGGAAVRVMFSPHVSLETSLDFTSFPSGGVDEGFFEDLEEEEEEEESDEEAEEKFDKIKVDTKGSLSSLIFFPALLIHFEGSQNVSFYFLVGAGYQFNQSDSFEAKVTGFEEEEAEEDGTEEETSFTETRLTTLDVDVDDGFIFGLGIGADLLLAPNFVLNVDLRYHFAEFDVTQKGTFEGVPLELKKEESFDAVIFRTRLFFRF